MDKLPVLSLLTFIPAFGALGVAMFPGRLEREAKSFALGTSLVVLGLAAWAGWAFDPTASGLSFEEDVPWLPKFGISYHLGVDGIALSMMMLTALLQPMAILTSWNAVTKRATGFYVALMALQTGMMGVFAAADLFLFYVFWEIILIPMALMIGLWGGPRRIYAAVKFVLYTMSGSLLMFLALIYSVMRVYLETGVPTFDIATLSQLLPVIISPDIQIWLFCAFGLSFAIKVPMFPFHTWLPDAHVEAPTAGSVILAGVLLKMGSYGFLRFAIPFFPSAAIAMTPVILTLSVIGIVFGSLMSMAQTDIKKLIAYSSVAHLGFVMLGIFSGTVMGAQGGVIQMVNHGVSTGALFLLVGVIYERTHTRGVNDFGGLAKTMPMYATLFLIVSLSSIGLPGTNGFVGEFLVLMGTFQNFPVFAAIAGLGVVLGAAYMLTLYRNVFYGPPKESQLHLPEPNAMELTTLLPLVALIFLIGFLPTPLLRMTERPVTQVVELLKPAPVIGSLPGER